MPIFAEYKYYLYYEKNDTISNFNGFWCFIACRELRGNSGDAG